jgi:hypothetical protein
VAMMLAARAQEGPAPLDEPEQKKLIEDMKARALQYSKELPNFACVQVTRKNVDPTGSSRHWKLTETVHEELISQGGKEEYTEVAPSGKKSSGENRPAGLIAASEFSDIVSWIFDPKYKGEFQWTKSDSLRGHRVQTVAYKIPNETSQLTVGKKGQFKVGMVGVIDVDADTASILRIAVVAMGLPKNAPVSVVSMEFHFDFSKIGDHYFLLPLKADLQSKEAKALMWNEVEFREYRKP